MPKIPTFTAQTRITSDVADIKTQYQAPLTGGPIAQLIPAMQKLSDYYVAQQDLTEKVEAKKETFIIKGEADKFLKQEENNFNFSGLNVNRIVWTKTPNFAEQVNHGARIAKSKWITIFEFDDEYSNIWFKGRPLCFNSEMLDEITFLPPPFFKGMANSFRLTVII